jgi:hypothetical protein
LIQTSTAGKHQYTKSKVTRLTQKWAIVGEKPNEKKFDIRTGSQIVKNDIWCRSWCQIIPFDEDLYNEYLAFNSKRKLINQIYTLAENVLRLSGNKRQDLKRVSPEQLELIQKELGQVEAILLGDDLTALGGHSRPLK